MRANGSCRRCLQRAIDEAAAAGYLGYLSEVEPGVEIDLVFGIGGEAFFIIIVGFGFEAERTTPEAPDLEKLFRQVVDAGWRYAVMEVSSHAIEMKRVAGLQFEVAIFTTFSTATGFSKKVT